MSSEVKPNGEMGLRRVMGLPAAIATVVGLVVCNTGIVSAGQGFGMAGPGFIIAMLAAVILNVFIAFSFAELSSMFPKAGGISSYTMPAMGPFIAILSVISGYVVVCIFAGTAEITVPGLVINEFVPGIPAKLVSTILLLLMVCINIRGIEFYSLSQIFAAVVKIGSIFLVGVIGLCMIGFIEPVVEPIKDYNPMGIGVLGLTAIAFWMFIGVEFVCPLAEELRDPEKQIPFSMLSSLGVILVIFTVFGLTSINFVPMADLAASSAPHVQVATAVLGKAGQVWMAILAIFMSFGTANTLIASIPRMLYGMAQEGQIPGIFGVLHKKYQTPWVSISFIGLCLLIPLWIGVATVEAIVVYILAAAFSWFITYIISHLDVIILRAKYPGMKRSFKTPFYPLPQVLGIAGMLYMMFNIFPDPEMRSQIYVYAIGFLVVEMIICALLVKIKMKKRLFEVEAIGGQGEGRGTSA